MRTRKFAELEAQLSPESRARVAEKVEKTLAEMRRQDQLNPNAVYDEEDDDIEPPDYLSI